MDIENWDIERPIPYDRNPRRISDKAVAEVANSISEAGFRQPIVVNKDGIIIVGHTRLKAAQKLGLKEVPVHVADLTPEQEKAYRIRDNKSGEFSEWDIEMLAVDFELPELELMGFDLEDLAIKEVDDKIDIEDIEDDNVRIYVSCREEDIMEMIDKLEPYVSQFKDASIGVTGE